LASLGCGDHPHRYDSAQRDVHGHVQLDGVCLAHVEIETVHGPVTLRIPEGTQSGAIFKLKEKGVTQLNSRGRGDHLVEVIVKIPRGLTRKQKKILEEIGDNI